ncbi:MAG: ABC transporter permease [Bacilli bacterium]|jgi:simple sugar transport system permease protein|nr:ABC transporter permease [Bacilli bacterium]
MEQEKVIPPKKPVVKNKKVTFFKRPVVISIFSSLISILIGLLIGFFILIFVHPSQAMEAFGKLIVSGFSSQDNIAHFFYLSAPIMLTGLAVAFTFKAGSFNIGGPGQYIAGGFFALYGALVLNLPWYVCLLLSLIGGGIWGFIPGILKAAFNVNEVLSAIMLNWIGLISAFLAIKNIPGMIDSHYSSRTAIVSNVNPGAVLPSWGLEAMGSGMTIAFFIGAIFAVICWVILNKTTLGFEIKACGFNKDAANYAGIPAKKNIVLAFIISGALAGLGGGIYYLSPTSTAGFVMTTSSLPSAGFDGISVALLAANNPLGCIISALFVAYLTVSGSTLQAYDYAPEVITVVVGVIVYFASFVAFFQGWLLRGGNIKKTVNKLFKKPEGKPISAPAAHVETIQPAPEAPKAEIAKEKKETVKTEEGLNNYQEPQGVSPSLKDDNEIDDAFIASLAASKVTSEKSAPKTEKKEEKKPSETSKNTNEPKAEDKDKIHITESPFGRSQDMEGYLKDNPINDDVAPLERVKDDKAPQEKPDKPEEKKEEGEDK